MYGAVHRRAGRIVVQYWFFEPVNLWSPVVPAAANAWQAHEGDWEHIAIVLDARGTPLQAGYAQHCRGVRTPWSRVPRRGRTLRPLVYVGLGSHASYPRPGVQATDPRCWPDPQVIVDLPALGYRLVDHAGGGRRITAPRLVRLTSTSPTWTGFAGTWGEDRYARLGDVTFKDGAGPSRPDPQARVARPGRDRRVVAARALTADSAVAAQGVREVIALVVGAPESRYGSSSRTARETRERLAAERIAFLERVDRDLGRACLEVRAATPVIASTSPAATRASTRAS